MKDSNYDAVVLSGPAGGLLAELSDNLVRGKLLGEPALVPGQQVRVQVHRCQPEEDYLLFKVV